MSDLSEMKTILSLTRKGWFKQAKERADAIICSNRKCDVKLIINNMEKRYATTRK